MDTIECFRKHRSRSSEARLCWLCLLQYRNGRSWKCNVTLLVMNRCLGYVWKATYGRPRICWRKDCSRIYTLNKDQPTMLLNSTCTNSSNFLKGQQKWLKNIFQISESWQSNHVLWYKIYQIDLLMILILHSAFNFSQIVF